MARKAEQLAFELERFYLPRDEDDHELPGLLDFRQLMTREEEAAFDQAIRVTGWSISERARSGLNAAPMPWGEYNGASPNARQLGYQSEDPNADGYAMSAARQDAIAIYELMLKDHTRPGEAYGGVPTLPDLLRRIAQKFKSDGEDPPIKSPNLGTAERSFFARELCKYFWKSYGDVSPSIVRDIVAMFYEGGVTEGNVSQMIARIKARHPLPTGA